MPKAYWQKLQDPRWQRRRLEILNQSGFACHDCDDKEETLTVHHAYYEKGLEPWEYPDGALVCLCMGCHEARADAERLLLREMKNYKTIDLYEMALYLNRQLEAGFTTDEIVNYIRKGIPHTQTKCLKSNPS